VYADDEQRLAVMSIGFLLPDRNNAVVWRGPKKTGNACYKFLIIMQFKLDVSAVVFLPGGWLCGLAATFFTAAAAG
jgi:hypothetical protein